MESMQRPHDEPAHWCTNQPAAWRPHPCISPWPRLTETWKRLHEATNITRRKCNYIILLNRKDIEEWKLCSILHECIQAVKELLYRACSIFSYYSGSTCRIHVPYHTFWDRLMFRTIEVETLSRSQMSGSTVSILWTGKRSTKLRYRMSDWGHAIMTII